MKQQLRELVEKALDGVKYPRYADYKDINSLKASYISDELWGASRELKEYKEKNYPNIDNTSCPKTVGEELDSLFSD